MFTHQFWLHLQVLANPLLPSAERLNDFNLKKHAIFYFGKMQIIYILFMPFLLKNGPNSNKAGRGHILPLSTALHKINTSKRMHGMNQTEAASFIISDIIPKVNYLSSHYM